MAERHLSSVPQQARAVIIGGGVVGCTTAYHLAKLGWRDVVPDCSDMRAHCLLTKTKTIVLFAVKGGG